MSFRSGTQKYGSTNEDKFVDIDGYSRNLALEERLQREEVANRIYDTQFKGIRNPIQTPTPSWWGGSSTNIGAGAGYLGWRNEYTDQEVLEYLNIALKFFTDKVEYRSYQCRHYPRDVDKCQLASHNSATVSNVTRLIEQVKKEIAFDSGSQISETVGFIPQVFAEEDPSVNSGLNGNNQESQMINYPQSANVRISFTNSSIGMFSSSIPIADVSQLQILSNESNEWRYTLIGSSTNQPLMTLSGLINKINNQISSVITPQPQPPIEEEPITTDHVPPPEIELPPEVPMVTVTPTEPGQINWIPEPFFSIINSVFRR